MALALVAQLPDYSRRRRIRRVGITFTGIYAQGPGVPLDLTAITNPNFYGDVLMSTVPLAQDIEIVNSPGGYLYEIIAGTGTTLATAFNLKISTAPGAELPAAAYPAAILAAQLNLQISQKAWS
jgi:hypothetical protein